MTALYTPPSPEGVPLGGGAPVGSCGCCCFSFCAPSLPHIKTGPSAVVNKKDDIVTPVMLTPGSLFGEMAVLGVSLRRQATIHVPLRASRLRTGGFAGLP